MSLYKKHVALPQEHGTWVFLLSPLIIGIFAGGRWTAATGFLVLGALALFFFKQPLTIAVKVRSGRRPKKDLPSAYFWMGAYGAIGLVSFAGLWWQGHASLAVLGLPALPVLVWYLVLVSRRAERRQIGVEMIASGALALTATAAYWIGVGVDDPLGWWLWLLSWLQSASSIGYAALRLEQRGWNTMRSLQERYAAARRALLYTTFNVLFSFLLGVFQLIPPLVWLAFGVQWAESVWGMIQPAAGFRPTRIGIRQLIVSILFTVVFILAWGAA